MKKILVIKSSISTTQNSISDRAVDIFIENYKISNPDHIIEVLNLNKESEILKPLTSETLNEFFDDKADQLIEQLKSADKIVITAGMVNFNIPTSLKSYFDNVLQANKTFKYKYKGNGESFGLLNPEVKAQLILSQGAVVGWYPYALFDKYLEGLLNFIGIKQINTIIYDGTKTDAKSGLKADEIINREELIKLSKNF